MKIGIMGAMVEEISSVKEMMIIHREITIADRVYTEGKINNKDIVIVFSRWGKVAAASTTTTLINLFEVDFILFTGVAGAVDKGLNIGDIVIGCGLYQHDMDARPFFNQFQIPLTSTIVFEPNISDIHNGKNAAQQFINKIDNIFTPELLQKYSISKPLVHLGLIASGDKFILDPKRHSELRFCHKEYKTLAVEMEGASVAQICDDYNIPCIIIRVISDKADHSAVIDFPTFVNNVANRYSSGIIKEYLAVNND